MVGTRRGTAKGHDDMRRAGDVDCGEPWHLNVATVEDELEEGSSWNKRDRRHLSASSRMTILWRPGGSVTFFWANILILFRTTSMPLQVRAGEGREDRP